MSLRDGGASLAIAYREGRRLPTEQDRWNKSGSGWAVVDVDARTTLEEYDHEQEYTDKVYKDFTIALGVDERADVTLKYNGGTLTIGGAIRRSDGWFEFKNRAGRIGVLPLPVDALDDRVGDPPLRRTQRRIRPHVVVYHSAEGIGSGVPASA